MSDAGGTAGSASSGGTGPLAIWQALLSAGASSIQAAGIMGNMIAESSLNPEAVNPAGPSGGIGLVQWESSSYGGVPGYNSLVTGNPAQDIQSQVQFLAQTGGFQAASGSTVSEAAGNFAANYERCSTCQPGQSQFLQRVANAAEVAGWAASGSWPSSAGTAAASATLTSAELAEQSQALTTQQDECLWGIGFNWGSGATGSFLSGLPLGIAGGIANALSGGSLVPSGGNICLISKTQARWVFGALIITGGVSLTLFGTIVMMASAGLTATGIMARVASPVTWAVSQFGTSRPVRGMTEAQQRAAGNAVIRQRAAITDAADRNAAWHRRHDTRPETQTEVT